jgi:hypothetical protein
MLGTRPFPNVIGSRRSRASFVGALDAYSTLVTGVWSVPWRRLTSYTGNLIRVRRVSDSVESDFGPLANGRLDVASITTFLGGSAGKITTVYDQQGTNNWTESSAAVQPDWVSALSQFNNAPALHAIAGTGMSCSMSPTRPYSILLTECNPDAVLLLGLRTLDSTGGNRFISSSRNSAGQAFDGATIAPATNTALAVCQVLAAPSSGNYVFYSNGTNVTTGSVGAQNWGALRLGIRGVWLEPARSHVADIVTFNTNLNATQVTAIQTLFNPATL